MHPPCDGLSVWLGAIGNVTPLHSADLQRSRFAQAGCGVVQRASGSGTHDVQAGREVRGVQEAPEDLEKMTKGQTAPKVSFS